MNRIVLIAVALLAFAPAVAHGQATVAPTYQGQEGQTKESIGTFAQFAAGASAGIPAVSSTAVEGGRVVKASPGNLYGLNVVTGAAAGYVLVINAISVPADGAVAPVKCYAIAANTSLDLNLRAAPVFFSTGIAIAFSSTGCFTKTASATAFISGDAR